MGPGFEVCVVLILGYAYCVVAFNAAVHCILVQAQEMLCMSLTHTLRARAIFAAFHRIANCHIRKCVAIMSSHMGLRARCDLWASFARFLDELGAISGRARRDFLCL